MPSFKEFYTNYSAHRPVEKKKVQTAEEVFESVVGESVSNVDSFVAWLVLNEHIKSYIKPQERKKPISIYNLPTDKKMLYLVKKLPNVRVLAKEFNETWN